ncbi:MAG: haloacid dehalogenase [Deltaproteobacteria bacterium]|nr:haloacid dehalogenase [Deltaproteobacteria bacterium]
MIDPNSIAFDIDGVLADIASLFIEIARKRYNIKGIAYNDITSYELENCLDIDTEIVEEIIGGILSGRDADDVKPIPGASEVLTKVANNSGQLLFVTARPDSTSIYSWMQNILSVEPEMIDIVATGAFEDKADVLLSRNKTYFVEDRLDTCFHLEVAGITPLLFKQPWNRADHSFLEVGNWKELESMIKF